MPEAADVKNLFGRIARRYDLANHALSGGIDLYWRARLVAAVRRSVRRFQPVRILDLATGSGDVALALSRRLGPEVEIVGMDFCAPMLEEAELKKAAAHPARHAKVTFELGDGLALPLPDASFEAVTIAFGFRNMADRARCLSEMRRVLRPGGTLHILEFSQPAAWFRPLYYWHLNRFCPWLAGLLTGERFAYDYLSDSIARFPDREGLSSEIRAAGFEAIQAQPLTLGIVALHQAARPMR